MIQATKNLYLLQKNGMSQAVKKVNMNETIL